MTNSENALARPIPTTRKHRRRKALLVAFGTTILLALAFSGWVYKAKTHRSLNARLLSAVKANDTAGVRLLLAHGADPNIYDVPEEHLSLWQQIRAAFRRDNQGLNALQNNQGATTTINHTPTLLETALSPDMYSEPYTKVENAPLIEALLNAGARVDESSLKHQTPLMTAVEYGRLKTVQLLLDHGANPLARDDNGKLPIHHMIVASHNPLPIAELLVKLGNDINAVDALGTTPLMITDDLPTRRFLLAKGANINAQAKNGDNALLRATGVGDTKAIQLMLDHGAKVDLCDNDKSTPLDAAVQSGSFPGVNILPAIKMLLAYGAKIDPINADGNTPLTSSLTIGDKPEIVKLLLAHGADVNHHNKAGQTALSLAIKHNYNDLIVLLKAAGAKH